MLIFDAQRETYVGGFYGQLVSGAVWLAAAALGTWGSTAAGIVALLAGAVRRHRRGVQIPRHLTISLIP